MGSSDIGMLAWHLFLRTPEFPEGRSVVLIANDVTHQAGGASHLHGKLGIPRDLRVDMGRLKISQVAIVDYTARIYSTVTEPIQQRLRQSKLLGSIDLIHVFLMVANLW